MKVVRIEMPGMPARMRWMRFSMCSLEVSRAHELEHARMNVLQRHVDVAADLLTLGDAGDELVAPVRRVRVEQADPEIAFDLVEFAQELHQRRPARAVHLLPRPGLLIP
ncbi:MAG: hypothetical protein WDN28_25810 [Chthoniobacter sp.]